MKLLKILLIISSFFLFSCASLPDKPTVVMCVVDYSSQEGICGSTAKENLSDITDSSYDHVVWLIKASPDVTRVPLSTLDRGVLFMPTEWEKVHNYMDLLRRYAESNCK